jgi:L-Ala-D/L-Glu epimerase
MVHGASITGVRSEVIDRKTPSRLNTPYGTAPPRRSHVIVHLEAGDVWGFGEASPLPEFTGETVPHVARVIEKTYGPPLVGRDPWEIAAITADLDHLLPGNPGALCAVDIALHDLVGKLSGRPVFSVLGGRMRPGVHLARAIGIGSMSETVLTAGEYVRAGFRTLKLKVGLDAAEDVERVLAVREAVGPDVAIRIDANQGYDLETALDVIGRLEACGLEYIEQPLPAANLQGLRRLRRETQNRIRLMADESVRTAQDALALAAERLVDAISIKLVNIGGLYRARAIAAVAAAAGIDCVVSSPYETQIGAAAGLHFAVTLERSPYAHELTVFITQREMAETDIALDGDLLRPGTADGLGVSRIAETSDISPSPGG